jgi:hypothetical protein
MGECNLESLIYSYYISLKVDLTDGIYECFETRTVWY